MLGFLAMIIIAMLIIIVGWHLIFPLLGGALVITGAAWFAILATIIAFSMVMLFAFIFTGIGIFILGILFSIGVVIAIVLFPVLFPIVLPLFIVYWVVSYLRRRKKA